MAKSSLAVLNLVVPGSREAEGLFARDEDDALIRREKKTQDDFKQEVVVTIDGRKVTVPKAVPMTDAQGNPRIGADGKPIPRATTIYDAAARVFGRDELSRRIPVLCHQEHVNPVAVCRMCSVHASRLRKRDGKLAPGEKLLPACQHEVQDGMIVTTRGCDPEGNDREFFLADPAARDLKIEEEQKATQRKDSTGYANQVNGAVRLLTELLFADHIHPDPDRDDRYRNELKRVGDTVGIREPRDTISLSEGRNEAKHPKSRPLSLPIADDTDARFPFSARTITVDHDRCILCDRCVRACSEVKPFQVIGHTGKGYQTRISFDLDKIMNDSSCVQCGECMTSCPTGALTFRRRVAPQAFEGAPPIPVDPKVPLPAGAGYLNANETRHLTLQVPSPDGGTIPFRPFYHIPLSYLMWNEGAVRRRRVKPGEVLCRFGEYGNTAYLLEDGVFELYVPARQTGGGGLLNRIFGSKDGDGPMKKLPEDVTASQTILGELAVLSNKTRTTTIKAKTEGIIYEVTRNLLDMAQRSREARDVFDLIYRRNAIKAALRSGKVFKDVGGDQFATVEEYLDAPGVAEFRRVRPGETIVAEGDDAKDFYLIRVGFVKVSRTVDGREEVLAKLSSNESFGERALLGFEAGRRSASVVALDTVELVKIPGEQFQFLCDSLPQVKKSLIAKCEFIDELNKKQRHVSDVADIGEFVEQGLYQGQKLLVLDLESCTRCDECTRACADSHGDGISRLLREGMRFGQFLVATSCRSCHKPYCMDGCPVDAIHRLGKKLEIQIEDNCIGCGLCSANCPYGAIQMVARNEVEEKKGNIAAVAKKAVNCDLCHGLVPEGADTFCVAACPHEAAFRWDGEKLLAKVQAKSKA